MLVNAPYADRATENIRQACAETGAQYMRPARRSSAGALDGVFVPDMEGCVKYLRHTTGNVFLTIGSKELLAFCVEEALRKKIYARVLPMQSSLQSCITAGTEPDYIIAMQGPFDEELNVAMLKTTRAKYLVTKDTGSAGSYADKIHATERAGMQAGIIGRPAQVERKVFEEVVSALEECFGLTDRRKKVLLVSIGMGTPETRTLGMERVLREVESLIGAKRMLESVDPAGKEQHGAILAADIARIIRKMRRLRALSCCSPAIRAFATAPESCWEKWRTWTLKCCLALAACRISAQSWATPWEDVHSASLRGCDCNFAGAVLALLGGEKGANITLERLCRAGLGQLLVHVGGKLEVSEKNPRGHGAGAARKDV